MSTATVTEPVYIVYENSDGYPDYSYSFSGGYTRAEAIAELIECGSTDIVATDEDGNIGHTYPDGVRGWLELTEVWDSVEEGLSWIQEYPLGGN